MIATIGVARELTEHPALDAIGFEYAWLEAPTGVQLARLTDTRWRHRDQWPSGRIFGATGEYHWRTDTRGRLHAVLLLDELAVFPAGFSCTARLESKGATDDSSRDSHLMLWGDWTGSSRGPSPGEKFAASEIPHTLLYPVTLPQPLKADETLRLIVRHYVCVPEPSNLNAPKGNFMRCVGFAPKSRVRGFDASD